MIEKQRRHSSAIDLHMHSQVHLTEPYISFCQADSQVWHMSFHDSAGHMHIMEQFRLVD